MALRTRPTQFPELVTAVQTEQITAASRLVSYLTGFAIQPNKAIVGGNAFAHESGIHQDGIIKNPLTYEIMTPQSVGLSGSQLTIGKLSGRKGLQGKLHELGHDLEGEALDTIYRQAIALADAKKEVTDADLLALVEQRASEVPASVELVGWSVTSSHGGNATGQRQPDRPRRGSLGGGGRQRPGGRALQRGRPGPPAGLRLAPGPGRVRDQGGVGGEDAQGQVLVRCRRSSDEGPGALVGLRPRPLDEHHRGLDRRLPRGGQQAPRGRDQWRRRGVRRTAHGGRPAVMEGDLAPTLPNRHDPRRRRRARTSSPRREPSSTPSRPGSGSRSSGPSTSSAGPRSTPMAWRSGPRTSTPAARRTRSCWRGRRAEVVRPVVAGPPGAGALRPPRRARALREPPARDGPPGPDRLVAGPAGAARRRRPPDRPRADRRPLLRRAPGARPARAGGQASERHAYDTLPYTEGEIRRVVDLAFELAAGRRRHVTSVDKANVLATSRLWRSVATEIGAAHPDVTLAHQLVDSCAMLLVRRPADFDVIVTENLFGDILTRRGRGPRREPRACSRRRRWGSAGRPTARSASTSRSMAPRRTSPAATWPTRSGRSSPRRCCSATPSAATTRRPPSRQPCPPSSTTASGRRTCCRRETTAPGSGESAPRR